MQIQAPLFMGTGTVPVLLIPMAVSAASPVTGDITCLGLHASSVRPQRMEQGGQKKLPAVKVIHRILISGSFIALSCKRKVYSVNTRHILLLQGLFQELSI